ncbi:MAG: dockerin type I domain-containing protein [Chloroflexia bacterium]
MSRIIVATMRTAAAVCLLGIASLLVVFGGWGAEARSLGSAGRTGSPVTTPAASRSVVDLRALPAPPTGAQSRGGVLPFQSNRRGPERILGSRHSALSILSEPLGYGAPAVITGFNGIDINDSAGQGSSCFCLPPDGDMAAGPNHVIVDVNQAFRVFNKSGSPQTPSISFDAFFNGCGPSGLSSSDGIAAYDPAADRFTVGILRFNSATDDSYVSLAVSTSGDPTDTWNRYCFQQLQNGLPALYDFPHISVGQTALYTTGNVFPPGFEQNTSARVNAFPKAQMYAGAITVTQVYTDVVLNSDLTPADTIRPALFNRGLPSPTNYFVNSSSTPGSSRVTLWRWTDPFGANVFEQAGGVDVALYLQAVPMLQPAPGQPMPPAGYVDNRTLGAIWWNGTLYATHAIGCNAGTSVTDCIQWYQLGNLNGAPSLQQQGIISGTNESRAYPNVAVDRYGNVELSYVFSSLNDFIGIRHTGRLASDPLGEMGPEGVIKAGEMAEVGKDALRYGDYSGSVLDPADGVTLWHFEEYTQNIPDPFQLGSWGTWTSASRFPTTPFVGHVTWQGPPPQPDPRQALPITLTLRLASGRPDQEFRNLATDASGFFTVSVGTFPAGTYNWRVKDPKYLANAGTVSLAGAVTGAEMGLMRAGDCNNDNVVNAVDFAILKSTFGKSAGQVGYDDRAEFNGDGVVNVVDFALQRENFGHDGAPPISP